MAKKYFSRKFDNSSQGSRQVATWSFWVRRIDLDYDTNAHYIIEHANDEVNNVTNRWAIRWRNDKLWAIANSGYWFTTDQVFRDTTSWYHIVLAVDLSQSNLSSRMKLWVNGELQSTSGWTNIGNTTGDGGFGGVNERMAIGGGIVDSNTNRSMLLSQFVYVNGQQMQATDFGRLRSNGKWIAKSPAQIRTTVTSGGGFGTNGFLLPMESDVWYGNNGYMTLGSWPDRRSPGTQYRANRSLVTGNYASTYASKIHAQSSDTKYADAALVSASPFGENGVAGAGLGRYTSQSALLAGNDEGVETLSNATSYTMEFWVKKKDRNYAAAQGSGVWFNINASNGTNSLLFRDKNGLSTGWDIYVGGAAGNQIGNGSYSSYNFDWQHIAWVWDGTDSRMYCDGVYVGSLTHGNVINSGSYITVYNETDASQPGLGLDNHSAGTAIESWRIVANQTLYTGGSTPGDNVFTPGDIRSATTFTTDGGSTTSNITGTVTHLFYLDKEHVSEVCKDQGRISADSTWRPNWRHSGYNRLPHLSGDSKFGKSSIAFHQNGAYGGCLIEDRCGYSGSVTGSQFDNVFNGDHTIEFWFKVVSVSTATYYPRVFDLGGGNTDSQYQLILARSASDSTAYNAGIGCPFIYNSGAFPTTRDSGPTYTDVSSILNDGTWHHYASTRSGNVWRQFLDGNLFKQNTVSINFSPIAHKPAVIGTAGDYSTTALSSYSWPTNGGEFRGNIDQFRVVDGQALYTSNFTPGDCGSTTTYSTNGTSQNNSITGQVVCLIDPDVKTAATDISTGDTVSSNGFDMHNTEESGEKCLDSPDNVFCAFTDIDNTGTDGGPTNMTWGRAYGMSQSVKEVYGGSMGCRSGKWYFEITDSHNIDDWSGSGGGISIGWITAEQRRNGDTDIGGALDYGAYSSSFGARSGASGLSGVRFQINQQSFVGSLDTDNVATTRALKLGDTQGISVLGVATDLDAGTITYYVNGTQSYTRTDSSIGRGEHLWQPAVQLETATSTDESNFSWNFGDSAATNTSSRDSYFADENGYGRFFMKPPTGYLAICSKNLESNHNSTAITDGSQHMQCVAYTGTGSSLNVQTNFQPALLMIKHRDSNTTNQFWFDRLRGVSNATYGTVRPTTSGAATSSANYMTDFLSTADGDSINGFTVNSAETNTSGGLNIAWCWRADDSFTPTGTSISNASGLRNTDAGFSIVKWDGASGGGNITHGLNQAPEFVIYKNVAATNNWDIYHDHISGPQKSAGDLCDGLIFTDAVPRSNSVKKPGSSSMDLVDTYTNGANKVMVAYCWHSVSGYSSFGAYRSTGNTKSPPDTDEAFVNTGFKPAFVMVKSITNANDWSIRDNARETQNPRTKVLRWNTQGTAGTAGYLEEQDATGYAIDFLANGFRIKTTGAEQGGTHGDKFIYAAWAELPAHLANAVV